MDIPNSKANRAITPYETLGETSTINYNSTTGSETIKLFTVTCSGTHNTLVTGTTYRYNLKVPNGLESTDVALFTVYINNQNIVDKSGNPNSEYATYDGIETGDEGKTVKLHIKVRFMGDGSEVYWLGYISFSHDGLLTGGNNYRYNKDAHAYPNAGLPDGKEGRYGFVGEKANRINIPYTEDNDYNYWIDYHPDFDLTLKKWIFSPSAYGSWSTQFSKYYFYDDIVIPQGLKFNDGDYAYITVKLDDIGTTVTFCATPQITAHP